MDRPTPERVEAALQLTIHHAGTAFEVLAAEVQALREELEVERMRLAMCGVAAHGISDERFANMRPEYDSDALRATRALCATIERVATLPRCVNGNGKIVVMERALLAALRGAP